jgi:hypothetical protein
MKICYVTAYLELNREGWSSFARPFEVYLANFTRILETLFDSDNQLVAFVDEKRFEQITRLIPRCSASIVLIPINRAYMEANVHVWSLLPREVEIMSSPEYKRLLSHRLMYPEHSNPEYTMINHAKIDFVALATRLTSANILCWVDFGYVNFPKEPLDLSRFDLGAINYTVINPIDEKDSDVMYTMLNAPERVGGFTFLGGRNKIFEYQKLYHDQLSLLQRCNLADDDQHLVLRCYFAVKGLFKFHHLPWHRILTEYSLPMNYISV